MRRGLAVRLLAACALLASVGCVRELADGALGRRQSSCEPTQVHLALTDREGEMRVSWTTASTGCLARLQYGRADSGKWTGCAAPACARQAISHLSAASSSTVDTYSSADMCGLPAAGFSFDPPNLHSAIMTGLAAGELYSYTIGGYGPPRTFRAAPRRGPDAEFSFIVYGDMGESEHRAAKSPGARTTSNRVATEVEAGAELVLHVGDVSYANGDPDIWNTFMDYIEPYATRAPYMLGIGNHEYDWRTGGEKRHKHRRRPDASGRNKPYDPDWGNYGNDSGGECGVAVARRFLMPGAAGLGASAAAPCGNATSSCSGRRGAAPPPNPPFWYSFEYGSVHFTVISTEHDLTEGSDQRAWLEADLAGVDRCAAPWLAVAMHRPMYVVFPHKSNRVVGEHLRASLEDLFEAYQVDLVLSGHVHAYARTCNVLDERCVDPAHGGMTHFTVGCGGRKLSDVEHEQPDWLAYAEPEWGYGRVTVSGDDMLLFEYVRSEDGAVRDSVRLRNARACARACQRGSPVSWSAPGSAALGAVGSEGAAPPAAKSAASGGGEALSQGAAAAAAPGASGGPKPLWLVSSVGFRGVGGLKGTAQAGVPGAGMALGRARAAGAQLDVPRGIADVDVA